MIIGSGLISNEFLKYEEYFHDSIIFASGVSSSTELNDEEFEREFTFIKKCLFIPIPTKLHVLLDYFLKFYLFLVRCQSTKFYHFQFEFY